MIRCIIVDDEQPARELMALHLSGLSNFLLLGSFENAVAAFEFIQQNSIDLLFVDIQMPKISGLQLIRTLKPAPAVILTTAYREYAAEAFELDVLDYLVKPITGERLMKAVGKFNHYQQHLPENPSAVKYFNDAYIFVKAGNQQTKIYLKDIVYLEGMKDYVKVHTGVKTFVASERLSYMEQKLPGHQFARIHKSFIVALHQITQFNSGQVTAGNTPLPVGRVFKNGFLKKYESSNRWMLR